MDIDKNIIYYKIAFNLQEKIAIFFYNIWKEVDQLLLSYKFCCMIILSLKKKSSFNICQLWALKAKFETLIYVYYFWKHCKW